MTGTAAEKAPGTLHPERESAVARPLVAAAWRRSMEHRIDRDYLAPLFQIDTDLDTPLVRAATPIMDALHEHLAGEAVAVMLTDSDGVVLKRHLTHPGLTTRLNRVQLVPGHVFSEESVGTNGIGTALASHRGVTIEGGEHFVEQLRDFHCAAVPILHPTRRTTLGVFNMTTMTPTPSAMTLALTSSIAGQIEKEVARITSRRDIRLFERYLATCRETRNLPVLAFNNDCLMMNDRLRATIVGSDHDALVTLAREAALGNVPHETLTLPSGLVVAPRLRDREPDDDSGHVVAVRVVGPSRARAKPPPLQDVPGVIGLDPSWQRALTQVIRAHRRRDLCAILGEPGTGKVHVAAAVHRRAGGRSPLVLGPPLEESEADEAEWLADYDESVKDEAALVIVRNIHLMGPRLRVAIADRLALEPAGRIVITAHPDALPPEDELTSLCPVRVELPSLRHRHGDLQPLARHFLRRHRPREAIVITASAQSCLSRYQWPQNVRQLERVIRAAAKQAAGADRIDLSDLPPECQGTGPALSPLETVEREALLRGLVERNGNVVRTARDLGIARATLYRKMRRYGIDPSAI